jgi:hypothetical protein
MGKEERETGGGEEKKKKRHQCERDKDGTSVIKGGSMQIMSERERTRTNPVSSTARQTCPLLTLLSLSGSAMEAICAHSNRITGQIISGNVTV